MATTQNLLNLKIHKLSQAQYDRELANDNIDSTALYLTPEEEPIFTGTGTLIKGTFNGTEQTASVEYTPAGTVSTPTITVEPNTTTMNSIKDVGKLPTASLTPGSVSLTASLVDTTKANKTVIISASYTDPKLDFDKGALPEKGPSTTVVTGIKSTSATQPIFEGTKGTISHKHTPRGTITITTATPGAGETANYTPAGTVDR